MTEVCGLAELPAEIVVGGRDACFMLGNTTHAHARTTLCGASLSRGAPPNDHQCSNSAARPDAHHYSTTR
jgi:hypothetical protein